MPTETVRRTPLSPDQKRNMALRICAELDRKRRREVWEACLRMDMDEDRMKDAEAEHGVIGGEGIA